MLGFWTMACPLARSTPQRTCTTPVLVFPSKRAQLGQLAETQTSPGRQPRHDFVSLGHGSDQRLQLVKRGRLDLLHTVGVVRAVDVEKGRSLSSWSDGLAESSPLEAVG